MKCTTKWQRMAEQDLQADAGMLYRFYERSGIYQYSAGMSEEDADRRAFMEIVRNES